MYYSTYRNRETGEIITREQLANLFSNTSFPSHPWPKSIYDYIGFDPIIDLPGPALDEFHVASIDGIIKNEQGEWVTNWVVRDLYPKEEMERRIKERADREFREKWDAVKLARDVLLTETDFTQLPDTPISDESKETFKLYRQQLRNITDQSDPYNITWPVKPKYIKS